MLPLSTMFQLDFGTTNSVVYFLARFILYPSPIGHYDIKLTLLVHGNVLHCLFSVFMPSHDVSTFEHARRFCC
jgi:hypothetical protein